MYFNINEDRKNEEKTTVTMANITPDDRNNKRRTTYYSKMISVSNAFILLIRIRPLFIFKLAVGIIGRKKEFCQMLDVY